MLASQKLNARFRKMKHENEKFFFSAGFSSTGWTELRLLLLNLIEAEKCTHQIPQSSTLVLNAKTGSDGSGDHRSQNQLASCELSKEENPHLDPTSTSNYLLCCIAPLSLDVVKDDNIVRL